jgi:membrane fusion protein (multidrug efflux system)
MKTARRSFPLALATLALSLGCADEPPAAVQVAHPVVVVPVEAIVLDERIEATGQLAARDHAEIASEVEGRITEVLTDEGQQVEEDQVLLAVDPEKRRLELANAEARLTEAAANLTEQERDLDRARSLHAKGIASQAVLDQAGTELELAISRHQAAQAQVGVAERALRDATVRAPFAGLVARRDVSRGEYVRVGQALFEIVALDSIEVEFTLAERDSARVATGQSVDVRVAPYPEATFQGEVTIISPTIDPRTRTLRVKARVPNQDGRLRPGLFARADLGVSRREGVLMVPEQAVLVRAEGEIVYVVDADDRAHRVKVATGTHHEGRVEVVEGLAAGDQVISRGQAGLADGVLVSRRAPDGSPERSELNVAGDGADLGAVIQ